MRLYYGTYGHRLSGKLYVYWGDDNLRTGQQVLAPVTNKRSGKNYDTMFTIARAQSQNNAQGEVNRLNGEGIFIKTLGGRELLSLPGGKPFSSKAEWKRDSDRRYRNRFGLPEPEKPVKSTAEQNGKKSSANSKKPIKGRRAGNTAPKKRKKQSKIKSKIGKALDRVGAALREVKYESSLDNAKASLTKNKTAADSFRQKERVKKLKQREAFTEE